MRYEVSQDISAPEPKCPGADTSAPVLEPKCLGAEVGRLTNKQKTNNVETGSGRTGRYAPKN